MGMGQARKGAALPLTFNACRIPGWSWIFRSLIFLRFFICRDGPAWYGVGLLIRWSHDLRGSNPRPGAFNFIYLFLADGHSPILLGMYGLTRI